ncbi:MAG: hypothetical protein MGAcid_12960 [uncultured Acidilobus sp. MG]|nr:MAG: hypothetical protein MGAcid_12960 [uncultured Acidilobus sp. MG]
MKTSMPWATAPWVMTAVERSFS